MFTEPSLSKLVITTRVKKPVIEKPIVKNKKRRNNAQGAAWF